MTLQRTDARVLFPFTLRQLTPAEGGGYLAFHPRYHLTYVGDGVTEEEAINALVECVDMVNALRETDSEMVTP